MSLSSISILRSYEEAILVPAWQQTINEEMNALVSRGTWELVSTPKNAIVVGCRWAILWSIAQMVQWIGIRPDLLLKVMLRLMAWITLRLFTSCLVELYQNFFSIDVNLSWPLFQLDAKDAFLYGNLKEVYVTPRFPKYVGTESRRRSATYIREENTLRIHAKPKVTWTSYKSKL